MKCKTKKSKRTRARKAARIEQNLTLVTEWASRFGFDLVCLNSRPAHYRLSLPDIVKIDFWPATGRHYILGTYEKGTKGGLEDLMREYAEGEGRDPLQALAHLPV